MLGFMAGSSGRGGNYSGYRFENDRLLVLNDKECETCENIRDRISDYLLNLTHFDTDFRVTLPYSFVKRCPNISQDIRNKLKDMQNEEKEKHKEIVKRNDIIKTFQKVSIDKWLDASMSYPKFHGKVRNVKYQYLKYADKWFKRSEYLCDRKENIEVRQLNQSYFDKMKEFYYGF